MKNSLDMLLPEDYSTLCRAVLLGEKQLLIQVLKMIFIDRHFVLIVVSGMHLVIITSFVLLLVRKLTKNRF